MSTLYRFRDIVTYLPKFSGHVTLNSSHLGTSNHGYDSTRHCQSARQVWSARFKDMVGVPKLKNGPRDRDHAHFGVICHTKANIGLHARK